MDNELSVLVPLKHCSQVCESAAVFKITSVCLDGDETAVKQVVTECDQSANYVQSLCDNTKLTVINPPFVANMLPFKYTEIHVK